MIHSLSKQCLLTRHPPLLWVMTLNTRRDHWGGNPRLCSPANLGEILRWRWHTKHGSTCYTAPPTQAHRRTSQTSSHLRKILTIDQPPHRCNPHSPGHMWVKNWISPLHWHRCHSLSLTTPLRNSLPQISLPLYQSLNTRCNHCTRAFNLTDRAISHTQA